MTIVRLLADDLTGALDTAAEFVPLAGPLPVMSGLDPVPEGSVALDSGTREWAADEAARLVGRLAGALRGADVAFKKIDSLLRGATVAEIAACMQTGHWRQCALAPAFPYQGRITRLGRQYRQDGTDWKDVSGDLVAALRAIGVPAGREPRLRSGVTVFDAETDAELQQVVAEVRSWPEPVLWAGTGGLAQALAAGCAQPALTQLPKPILGLFGSDQQATADQLASCLPHWLELRGESFHNVAARLAGAGLALVSFAQPAGIGRQAAANRIAAAIDRLTRAIDRPGSVVVAGGETLRSLCDAVGATSLMVQGRLVPGVPISVLSGGRWDGVTVVSKSGAFGHRRLLRELILERAKP